MKALVYLKRTSWVFLLALLLTPFATVHGQDATTKAYIAENGRLKLQRDALVAENTALKSALQAEQQKSAQLQASLDKVQPAITERDQLLAEKNALLASADHQTRQWQLLAMVLAWVIVGMVFGMLVYHQRALIGRQIRKLMERQAATAAAGKTARQLVRSTGAFEEGTIRPEELMEKLYGRRRA